MIQETLNLRAKQETKNGDLVKRVENSCSMIAFD